MKIVTAISFLCGATTVPSDSLQVTIWMKNYETWAIGKTKRVAFQDTQWTELLTTLLKSILERPDIAEKTLPKEVQDIHVDIVVAPTGGGTTQAR